MTNKTTPMLALEVVADSLTGERSFRLKGAKIDVAFKWVRLGVIYPYCRTPDAVLHAASLREHEELPFDGSQFENVLAHYQATKGA